MKKYEELDIEKMSQAAICRLIRPSDIITYTGPGEKDVSVREVGDDLRMSGIVTPGAASVVRLHENTRLKVTKIERPIPELELPTEPGYYESAKFPLSDRFLAYRLLCSGQWRCDGSTVSSDRMSDLMPLTRLVPETEAAPAKLADRLDVEKLVDLLRRNASSITGYYRDAEALVAAIDNGELDK